MTNDKAQIRSFEDSKQPMGQEAAPEDYLTTIDFLEEGEAPPKITREQALIDFKKMLKAWKVLRKAIQKAKSGKRNREHREMFNEAQEIIIDAIMHGALVIHGDPVRGVTITHNLIDPPGAFSQLEYKKIPKLVDMRKMDEFQEQEAFAQSQALAAAMSGRATAEMVGLSVADLDVLGALSYFFV